MVPFSPHTLQSSNIYLLLDKSLDLNAVTYKQAKRSLSKNLPFKCKLHFSEAADPLEELSQMRFNGMQPPIMENTEKHNGAKTELWKKCKFVYPAELWY